MTTTNYTAAHFSKLRLQSEANELRAQCNNLKVVLRVRPPKTLEHESPAFNIKHNQVDDDKENNNSETSKIFPNKLATGINIDPETSGTHDLVQLTSVTQQRGILSTRHNQQEKVVNYKFNKIYKSKTNQTELFEGICSPVIDDFFRGKNGFLMDYGCTGSGKTFTLMGNNSNPGLIPQTLDSVFEICGKSVYRGNDLTPLKACEFTAANSNKKDLITRLKTVLFQKENAIELMEDVDKNPEVSLSPSKTGSVFAIFISMIEIYNENVIDLLDAGSIVGEKNFEPRPTSIFEDSKGNPYVRSMNWFPVFTTAEALTILQAGKKRRHIAATELNQNSSRAHSIINIRMATIPYDYDSGEANIYAGAGIRSTQITFVDLAGAERFDKAHGNGRGDQDRLQEAGKIHTSLLTLGRVLTILRDNSQVIREYQKNPQTTKTRAQNSIASTDSNPGLNTFGIPNNKLKPVPFRESKLTRLLQKFFVGKSKCIMIVNISLTQEFLDETTHVLKFSSIARDVNFQTKKVEKEYDVSVLNRECDGKSEISKLENTKLEKTKLENPTKMLKPPVKRKPTLRESGKKVKTNQGTERRVKIQEPKNTNTGTKSLTLKSAEKEKSSLEKRYSELENYVHELEDEQFKSESKIKQQTRDWALRQSDLRVAAITEYYTDIFEQREDEHEGTRKQLKIDIKEKITSYKQTMTEQQELLEKLRKENADLQTRVNSKDIEEDVEESLRKDETVDSWQTESTSNTPLLLRPTLQSTPLEAMNIAPKSVQSTPVLPNTNSNTNFHTNSTPNLHPNFARPPSPNGTAGRNLAIFKQNFQELKASEALSKSKVNELETELKVKILESKRDKLRIQELEGHRESMADKETVKFDRMKLDKNEEINCLKQRLNDCLNDLEAQYNQLQEYDGVKDQLKLKNESLQNLEDAVAEKSERIRLLGIEVDRLKETSKIEGFENKIQHLNSAKKQVEMFLNEKDQEVRKLKSQITVLEDDNQALKTAIENLNKNLNQNLNISPTKSSNRPKTKAPPPPTPERKTTHTMKHQTESSKNHNKDKFSSKYMYESNKGHKSQTLDRVKSSEDEQAGGTSGTLSGFFARLKASPKVTRSEAEKQPESYKRKLRQRNKK